MLAAAVLVKAVLVLGVCARPRPVSQPLHTRRACFCFLVCLCFWAVLQVDASKAQHRVLAISGSVRFVFSTRGGHPMDLFSIMRRGGEALVSSSALACDPICPGHCIAR